MQNASVTIRRRWERLSREFSVVYEIMVFAANAKLDNLKMLAVRVCVCVCEMGIFFATSQNFSNTDFSHAHTTFSTTKLIDKLIPSFCCCLCTRISTLTFSDDTQCCFDQLWTTNHVKLKCYYRRTFRFLINFVAINVEQTWNFSTYFSFIFDLNFYYFLFSTLKNGCWHVDWPKSESKPMSA